MKPKTLFEKLWEQHVVYQEPGYPAVLYIDAHLIHEVTSPQAFAGLKKRRIPLFRKQRTWATADHNVPTKDQHLPIRDALSSKQVEMLVKNCEEYGIKLFGLGHPYQGIVHVIGPELGITQPGMTIVCGDSHTSTHGAFGSIAFGIGTSEIEQVFATQTVLQGKPKTMRIEINGKIGLCVAAKDIILHIISKISTSGATGYFVEYTGNTIKALSMEERMTICNMSIEMGARGGIIAPDEVTFSYLKGRPFSPQGSDWNAALTKWKLLFSDPDAKYDAELAFDATSITPMITYGTNPGMGIPIDSIIPETADLKALSYMEFKRGQQLLGTKVDYVFIGSCTNSRIEDLRAAAQFVKGKKKDPRIHAFIVPGSKQVEKMAREEGLVSLFEDAGFELRQPGCSACLAMNEDKIPPGKYCVSTSNRNFEGRQGPGSRTLLASPLTAASAALTGVITDPRQFL